MRMTQETPEERASKILFKLEDGTTRDTHIETMYGKLYYLDYRLQEELLVQNFNLYCEVLFDMHPTLGIKSFDDVDALEHIIENVIGEINVIERIPVSSPFKVHFDAWGGKTFVQSRKYNIALALSIVHHMRLRTSEHFDGSSKH